MRQETLAFVSVSEERKFRPTCDNRVWYFAWAFWGTISKEQASRGFRKKKPRKAALDFCQLS